MDVFLNDELVAVPEGATLEGLLVAAGIVATNGIALAVNNQVVSKLQWSKVGVSAGDNVMVIRATQGG